MECGMKFRALLNVPIFFFSLTPVLADECVKSWTYQHADSDVIAISACKYASGKSGYYKVENLKNIRVRVCWEIEYNAKNYKKNKSCRTFKPGETSKGSCFSCNPVNGGVKHIDVTKYEVK